MLQLVLIACAVVLLAALVVAVHRREAAALDHARTQSERLGRARRSLGYAPAALASPANAPPPAPSVPLAA